MTAALVTPAEVARDYNRAIGNVYVLAKRHNWPRIRWQGRVYYRLEHVDATLGRPA